MVDQSPPAGAHEARGSLARAVFRGTTVALLAALLAACGGRAGGAGDTPPAPSLAGARIMLLPARAGSPAQLDAELAFWLTDRAPYTEWLLPAALQATVDRHPAWRVRLDALPREVVDADGGLRILDPLYGALRQLGAIEDTNLALVPVSARTEADGIGATLELSAALVDIRAGRVVWLGTVRGRGPDAGGAAVSAAAEALARALVPE